MTPLSSEVSAAFDSFLGPRGESVPDAARIRELRTAIRQAVESGQADALHLHLKSMTGGTGLHVGRVYTEASLAILRNDLATADLAFQPLAEKLNQADAWGALAEVALEWIEGAGTHPGVRYLVRSWKQAGASVVTEEMLRRAHAVYPHDPDLIWALATTLDQAGSSRDSRRLLATALKPLAESRDTARVEEGIIRLLEAPEGSIIFQALEAVDLLAHKGEPRAAAQLLESLQATTISHHLAAHGWGIARRAMEKHPNETGFRPVAVAFLKAAYSELPSLDRVIDVTGLDRLAVPPAQALKTLDLVLPFAPGFYVEHSGWGLGAVRDNDGEFLVIDFPAKPGHRMNLAAAAKVLKSLPADDLKVLLSVAKPKLLALRDEDPVGLILVALKRAGGQASAADIRKLLVPDVLATGEWSGWYKKTKEKLVADGRIDSRQSFNDVFRIPQPGDDFEDDFMMPPFDEPKGINHNIDLIHDFVDHHPALEDRLRGECLDRVRKWAERRTAKMPERARARLLLWRWEEHDRPAHEAQVNALFEEEFDLSGAGSAEEQLDLLRIGLAGPSRGAALRLGLNARNGSVRDAALTALMSLPGPAPIDFFADLLTDPVEYTDALFMAADKVALRPAEGDERLDDLVWPVMLSLLDLLNVTGREPVRKKGLKLLDTTSRLMGRVKALPPSEKIESQLMARLRDWRQSDRVLFPILESFSDAGLISVVESVRQKRKAAVEKLFASQPAADDVSSGPVIMSRVTFQKLHKELEQINLDLKTVIPQAIKKARELGDLRENAEYEAAKLKQANASKRLAQLDTQLEKVRILDDMTIEPGKAGPGTLVTVRDETDGTVVTYWILGEGDGDLGDHVISYVAPLGRALTGRTAGASVAYTGTDGVTKTLTLLSVEVRKP